MASALIEARPLLLQPEHFFGYHIHTYRKYKYIAEIAYSAFCTSKIVKQIVCSRKWPITLVQKGNYVFIENIKVCKCPVQTAYYTVNHASWIHKIYKCVMVPPPRLQPSRRRFRVVAAVHCTEAPVARHWKLPSRRHFPVVAAFTVLRLLWLWTENCHLVDVVGGLWQLGILVFFWLRVCVAKCLFVFGIPRFSYRFVDSFGLLQRQLNVYMTSWISAMWHLVDCVSVNANRVVDTIRQLGH